MNHTASSSELNMNEMVNGLMKQLEEKERQGRWRGSYCADSNFRQLV